MFALKQVHRFSQESAATTPQTSALTVKERLLTSTPSEFTDTPWIFDMPTANMPLPPTENHSQEDTLAHDERWLLIQRIVRSKGFQRAAQLRAILLYVSKFAIFGTEEQLREHDIAREALGRRGDFDPAYDNIVRVQVSHLRRKLAEYFADEGKDETMLIEIPKGSYLPHFESVRHHNGATLDGQTTHYPESIEPQGTTHDLLKPPGVVPSPLGGISRLPMVWASLGTAVLALAIGLGIRWNIGERSQQNVPPILLPMLQQGNNVAVVLPDVSLMIIQQVLNTEIGPLEYIESDFPRNQVSKVADPQLRNTLMFLGIRKTTSFSETRLGLEWMETLSKAGMHGNLLYSRDLHVRDLSDGNVILIGSRRSNPWMSLFDSRTNFQFIESTETHTYSFVNHHPLAGEETRYSPHHVANQDINYVNVALVHSLGEKGFALLINGSDSQANEAAVRFVLEGKFPKAIQDELHRKDFHGMEILLKGSHLDGESNDRFEIVTFRVAST